MAAYGFRRCARIGWALCLALLLQGCAAEAVFYTVLVAAQVADAAAKESALQEALQEALQDALTSRTFAYPLFIVVPAIHQAAQFDGSRIEPGYWSTDGLVLSIVRGSPVDAIVSYDASPSTGGAAGSVAVKTYPGSPVKTDSSGRSNFSTTVIVRRDPAGSEEAGRKVGEQLLDAMATDLANIERQVATKTIAGDVAAVFDALDQVGQRQDRKVLTRDAPSHSLRVSFLMNFGAMRGYDEGFLDITCVAAGGNTVVTLVGDGKSPALVVRNAANAMLAELTALLRQPG